MKRTRRPKQAKNKYLTSDGKLKGIIEKISISVPIAVIILYVAVQLVFLSTIHVHGLDSMKNFEWHKDKSIHILVGYINSHSVFNTLSILSIDKSSTTLLPLPDGIFVMMNGSNTQLDTIYALQNLQGNKEAMQTFLTVLEDNTQIPFDGYVFLSHPGIRNGISLNPQFFSVPNYSYLTILPQSSQIAGMINTDIETNFSLSSLFDLANLLNSQKLNVVSLASNDITDNSINLQNFSNDPATHLADAYVENERARISIYNGSGSPGKADFLGSMLENEGAIIDYTGDSSQVAQTTIYVNALSSFPATIEKLKRMTGGRLVQKQYSITSDISVVLGEDILSWF